MRSVELKFDILSELLGWEILAIDEEEFLGLDRDAKENLILDKLHIDEAS